MKWQAVVILFAIAVSIAVPPALSLTVAQDKQVAIGVLVTCNACGVKFPVYKLEKGIGGCYPIKFEGRMDQGNYRIPVATLEKMADFF